MYGIDEDARADDAADHDHRGVERPERAAEGHAPHYISSAARARRSVAPIRAATIDAMSSRFHAPYMEWAKTRPAARFDLAGSNVLACTLDDLEGARDALSLSGQQRQRLRAADRGDRRALQRRSLAVTTATGAAGANFQACAALLEPGDDVLMERPGYDPLLGRRPAARCAAAAFRADVRGAATRSIPIGSAPR